MIALIAGTGDLPGALVERLGARGEVPMICTLDGAEPDLPSGLQRLPFRLETLGGLRDRLLAAGVDRLCMAGAIRRPGFDPTLLDAATAPLVPRLAAALQAGDDGALRIVAAFFEEAGIAVIGPHQIAPDLLLEEGVPTRAAPGPTAQSAAAIGAACLAEMGAADLGQACVVREGAVIAREGEDGTDAMLARLVHAAGGVLVKGPKPGQDRRVDLPVIGPATAEGAIRARLSGLILEAGGVMVLRRGEVLARLDAAGLFLWGRPA